MLELQSTTSTEAIALVMPGQWFTLPNGDTISPAYAGWTNGEYILAEVPGPTPEELLQLQRQAMQLSFAQLLIGLVEEAWITEAEGEAWLVGQLPAPLLALIGTLPAEQQFPAKAKAIRPSFIDRLDPLVTALGQSQGKTDEELDAFFLTYSTR